MTTIDIWVVAEYKDYRITDSSLGLLREGKKLKTQARGKLSAIILAPKIEDSVQFLAHYGAEKIYLVEDECLLPSNPQSLALALAQLVEKYHPSILLFNASIAGRDLAPRVAARVRASLVTNCTILKIRKDGIMELTKPAYGGKVYMTFAPYYKGLQMATVDLNILETDVPELSKKAEIVRISIENKVDTMPLKIMDLLKADTKTMDLRDAEIIVAGGRGVGCKAGLDLIWELAEAIGGTVGGSRVLVDAGWLPFQRQVGQTGKTVSPRLYIACGISGAIQHQIGMKDAKAIMAINTDKNAPIFKIADIGIVGDLNQVIPEILKQLRDGNEKV